MRSARPPRLDPQIKRDVVSKVLVSAEREHVEDLIGRLIGRHRREACGVLATAGGSTTGRRACTSVRLPGQISEQIGRPASSSTTPTMTWRRSGDGSVVHACNAMALISVHHARSRCHTAAFKEMIPSFRLRAFHRARRSTNDGEDFRF